jgi:hypothetical protein
MGIAKAQPILRAYCCVLWNQISWGGTLLPTNTELGGTYSEPYDPGITWSLGPLGPNGLNDRIGQTLSIIPAFQSACITRSLPGVSSSLPIAPTDKYIESSLGSFSRNFVSVFTPASQSNSQIESAKRPASKSEIARTVNGGVLWPLSAAITDFAWSGEISLPRISRCWAVIVACCERVIPSSKTNKKMVQIASNITPPTISQNATRWTESEYFGLSSIIPPPTATLANTLTDRSNTWGQNGSNPPEKNALTYVSIAAMLDWQWLPVLAVVPCLNPGSACPSSRYASSCIPR